jgi:surface protein
VWNIPQDNTELFLSTKRLDYADFTIDWGDGSQEKFSYSKAENNCEDISHTYSKSNIYTIKIKGTLDGFGWSYFSYAPYSPQYYSKKKDDDASPAYLIEVKAFGPVGLGSYAFAFCENLKSLSKIDIPDASKLKTLERAFAYAGSFNLPLEHWDVSQVTDMSATFRDSPRFNQPLDHWDTSNVTKMGGKESHYNGGFGFDYSGVFFDATDFNQPLEHWDTSKVTTMANMFSGAKSFNQPLNDWDTSNVITMYEMFRGAEAFNQPLDHWNTSSLVYITDMFYYAIMFDQNISMWDVSKVRSDTKTVFEGSGISQQNYCNIVRTWNIGSLSKSYKCDNI